MARCILHIGWHKTGSTSLQMAARSATAALQAEGLHYPNLSHNHGPAIVSGLRHDEALYFPEIFVAPNPHIAGLSPKESGLAFLHKAVDEADGGDLFLSGEDLCLLREDEIRRLKALLSNAFEKIEVVAYVRNHDDYLDSVSQQLVRMGFSIPELLKNIDENAGVDPRVRVMSLLPHYSERIASWHLVFGQDAVHVHSYDQLVENGHDIISHFGQTYLNERTKRILLEARGEPRNSRFSGIATRVLSALHEETPLFSNGAPNPAFRFNLQQFFSDMTGDPISLAASFREEILMAQDTDMGLLKHLLPAPDISNMVRTKKRAVDESRQNVDQNIIHAMSKMGSAAIDNNARVKFFGALMIGKAHPQYLTAQGNLRVVLFLLSDPTQLANCAARLLGKNETTLASAFIKKAQQLGCNPKRIDELLLKVAQHTEAK